MLFSFKIMFMQSNVQNKDLEPESLTVEKIRHFAELSSLVIDKIVRTIASTLVEWLP